MTVRKEIRTQQVIRDGHVETVVTEDLHFVHDDDSQLDPAMSSAINKFLDDESSRLSTVSDEQTDQ